VDAPHTWRLDAVRVTAENAPRYHVAVEMWTHEEGPSDLTLEVDVWRDDDRWATMPRDLHVR
jgi:hypothetical protein